MSKLSKKDLSDLVAVSQGIYKKEAEALVDAVFDVLQNELRNHGEVNIYGFAKFHVKDRKATTKTLPNGEKIDVPAKSVPAVTFSPSFKEQV